SVIEPYIIYRLNTTLPSQFEVATIVHLKNKVWFGGSYKQNFGISAMAGLHMGKNSTFGYSYSLKNPGQNSIPFASHEIQLAFLFGSRKKNTTMYSFVQTEIEKIKKTPAQLAAEKKAKQAEEARKAEIAKQNQVKKQDSIANVKRIAEIERKQQEEKATLEAQRQQRIKDSIEVAKNTVPERHETVKRGNHPKELKSSNYIIVGAFRTEANARNYDAQLVKLGYPEAQYGFVTSRNIWYVWIAQAGDIEEARTIRGKYRESSVFKDAWLLTVQE
ncbi:MAG TPA: type IX secretion system membrane protein PorP/SprF, partial [Cyclobacteriaceae bacterium]